jgi:hypothetical protein
MDNNPPSNNTSSNKTLPIIAIVLAAIAIIIGIVAIVLSFLIKKPGPKGDKGATGATGATGPPGGNTNNIVLFPINSFTVNPGSSSGAIVTSTYTYGSPITVNGTNDFVISGTNKDKIKYNGKGGRYSVNICVDLNYKNSTVTTQMTRFYYNGSNIHIIAPNSNDLTTYQATYIFNLVNGDEISSDLYISMVRSVSSNDTTNSNYIMLTQL